MKDRKHRRNHHCPKCGRKYACPAIACAAKSTTDCDRCRK